MKNTVAMNVLGGKCHKTVMLANFSQTSPFSHHLDRLKALYPPPSRDSTIFDHEADIIAREPEEA
jgi:hypothetical protein